MSQIKRKWQKGKHNCQLTNFYTNVKAYQCDGKRTPCKFQLDQNIGKTKAMDQAKAERHQPAMPIEPRPEVIEGCQRHRSRNHGLDETGRQLIPP